ncbi:Ulp1 protease family [Abeliophyllum distichum]|uniref:Ulp1 protease family n=1 Tax=Abeliophyllum distichum TaxID=126358 RepID=A0ABD1V755_9LAMI
MRFKYRSEKDMKATSTNCIFDTKIRGIFDNFKKDLIILTSIVCCFPLTGHKIWFNTNWGQVNHVFIPNFMDKRTHWILVHFDIYNWHLDVYNSSFKTIMDATVFDAIDPFRNIIPQVLRQSKVLNFLPREFQLSRKLHKDILHQANGGDCEIFVVKYAEYIFLKKINEMLNDFDIRVARHNMAMQLFKYSAEKPNTRLPRISK